MTAASVLNIATTSLTFFVLASCKKVSLSLVFASCSFLKLVGVIYLILSTSFSYFMLLSKGSLLDNRSSYDFAY